METRWRNVFDLPKPVSIQDTPPGENDIWSTTKCLEWLHFLDEHAEAFDSIEILDDLATALTIHPDADAYEEDLRTILSRVRNIVAVTQTKAPDVHLYWISSANQPALRSIFRLHVQCEREYDDTLAMEYANWLLKLNPHDNHGLRCWLVNEHLRRSEDEQVIEITASYPQDFFRKRAKNGRKSQHFSSARALNPIDRTPPGGPSIQSGGQASGMLRTYAHRVTGFTNAVPFIPHHTPLVGCSCSSHRRFIYSRTMRSTSRMRTAHRASAGFTLLELMITVAVAAVLASVAIPNMRDFIRNNRLTSAANDLLRSAQLARSEAIKRQRTVVLCASSDPLSNAPSCSYDAFSGWIVFEDTNGNWDWDAGEAIVEAHDVLDSSLTVRNDSDAILSYAASGFTNPAGVKAPSSRVVFCDVRGNQSMGNSSTARAMYIEPTGRSRVVKDHTEVGTAIGVTGSCP